MKYEFRFKISALNFLLFLNIVIFVFAFLADYYIGFDTKHPELFYLFGSEITSEIIKGNFWMMVTSSFLHYNILHFFLNMYSLFKMGGIIEHFYDGKKLFITYIFGAIGASLLSTVAAVLTGSYVISLGASGSVFALVGLLFGGSMKKYRYGVSLPFSPLDILPVVVLPFLVGFLPGINNWAHLGGLLTGIILGLVFRHSMIASSSKFDVIIEKVLYWIAIILFIAAFVMLFVNALRLIYS